MVMISGLRENGIHLTDKIFYDILRALFALHHVFLSRHHVLIDGGAWSRSRCSGPQYMEKEVVS
jgi:hypothetical protein